MPQYSLTQLCAVLSSLTSKYQDHNLLRIVILFAVTNTLQVEVDYVPIQKSV